MTRLLIAVSVRLYRDGLRLSLTDDPTIEVVGTAATWAECQRELERLVPDVTLLDLDLPPSDEDLAALAAQRPDAVLLGLAVRQASDAVRFAEAGVSGYLTHDDSLEDLRSRIVNVRNGRQPCTPEVAGLLLRRVADLSRADRAPESLPDTLTARERQVLGFLDRGLSNKEIARRLHIQVATVKNHIHRVLEKMQVRGRAEAAARYRQHLSGH